MARAPTPQAEDRRRICRERKTLLAERIRHVNRIKGLLFSQGIGDYSPLRRDRRRTLEAVRTGDAGGEHGPEPSKKRRSLLVQTPPGQASSFLDSPRRPQ
jgi:transposase